jgi:hypothetical protein
MLEDPAIRWGLASALGVALAALAALWGHGFATRTREEDHPRTPSGVSVHAAGARSVAVSGNPAGDISTGDTGTPRTSAAPSARREPAPPQAPEPGAVIASGERSIAISGNPQGNLSTGDQQREGQS